jgi:uncharacterized protein YbaP (TraB family)
MTFINRTISLRSLLTVVVIVCVHFCAAQKKEAVENSLLWEVSGNGLKESSYLFGTFHLMGKVYVDSLTKVMSTFHQTKAMVGELIIDSTMMSRITQLSMLKGTTLDKLLTAEEYKKTAALFQELTGYDLKFFNGFTPLTIQIFMLSMLQKKFYAMDQANDVAMDLYFQKLGKDSGKPVIGLESFEVQAYASMEQFSYKRQAELLVTSLQDPAQLEKEMKEMNDLYRAGNLQKLTEMESFTDKYTPAEMAVMLDNRNKDWMQKLPAIFKQQSAFVAVGAAHLPGENGLIVLLRKAGYTVKPLAVR